ncbi:MAG: protein kinase, partial [Myxococcota bacterium]|nr:protein kinase [Myxococcota bacterium]
VYRGVQLATGRKVALKLLHPEMTKDDNLVARFRREGMVLCNLRDAHTITTYDFDQTPDGTLYIAMELLEGKSLHQIFHEQAPLEWKRVFKILTEMCSSLSEAHAQGIVHRDLKPENIYLENRPGNPEFVKILDFGIAKVMRGDSIDPQSPQLTATGQTLGTLEYMSPEQLMGPAGLITAQLKQTPPPPSTANAKAGLPQAADRVILKCLEKDKNNRWPDVTQLATALQEVINQESPGASQSQAQRATPPEMMETRRGEMPQNLAPPSMPHHPRPAHPTSPDGPHATPAGGIPIHASPVAAAGSPSKYPTPPHLVPANVPMTYPLAQAAPYQQQLAPRLASGGGSKIVWWIIGLLAFGAAAGAILALLMR